MANRTLVLNSGFEPIMIVPWQEAMRMIFLGKAFLIKTYPEEVRSAHNSWFKPSVIYIKKYVNPHTLRGKRFSRRAVYVRDGYQCQYCGSEPPKDELTLDHIIPKSKGGPRTWENMVTCCKPCNQRKANRTPKEARMTLMHPVVKPKWPSVNSLEDGWEEFV